MELEGDSFRFVRNQAIAFLNTYSRTTFLLLYFTRGVAPGYIILPFQGDNNRESQAKAFPQLGEREGGFRLSGFRSVL